MKRLVCLAIVILFSITLAGSFTACSSSVKEEKFVGTWEEVLDPSRITLVEKTDEGYTWQDPEGKYPAEFKNGTLLVKVGTETAKVTYSEKNDTLTAEYGTSKISLKRQK